MCMNSKKNKNKTEYNLNKAIKSLHNQIYNVVYDYAGEYNDNLVIYDCFKIYLNSDHDKYITVEQKFNDTHNTLNFRITTLAEVYTYNISMNMNMIDYIVSSGSFRTWFRDILLDSLFNILL